MSSDARRALPSVDRLVRALDASGHPSWVLKQAARGALEAARTQIAEGGAPGDVEADALARAQGLARPRPTRVVNATGVVIHTNFGRSALAPGAAEAAARAASGYSDLEFDLATGGRGDRLAPVADKLRLLSGAEGALAVNNAAAAVMLALRAHARGREVVVSRGELVEIGGSFRVPDILAQADVRLVEVGTTNRTRAEDYARAIGPNTGLLLKVHRSNFEQRGFVAEVPLAELVAIGHAQGVPVVEDLGSGSLVDLTAHGLPPETHAPSRLATGVDLVCFSGDKLLGGPQAGLVLGGAEAVAALRRHPLARALRLDKLSLAALDWTLAALLDGRSDEIPTLRMIAEPLADVEARARELAKRLGEVARGVGARGVEFAVEPSQSTVGGGSIPGFEIPSAAVAIRGRPPQKLAAALRAAPVPVIGRVADQALWLDARTLLPGDLEALEGALRAALEGALRGALTAPEPAGA